MVIKNGYEARLAKMAGDENVTIPKPTNAYMKYLDDIETGGSGGGGGSGGTEWLKVTITTAGDPEVATLDKTAGEIYAAFPFVIGVEAINGKFNTYRLESLRFVEGRGCSFSFQYGTESPWVFYASAAADLPTDQEPDAPSPSPN